MTDWISDRQTWPSLKVETELLPWHWHGVYLYFDDVEKWRYSVFYLGPWRITFSANKPMFKESEAA